MNASVPASRCAWGIHGLRRPCACFAVEPTPDPLLEEGERGRERREPHLELGLTAEEPHERCLDPSGRAPSRTRRARPRQRHRSPAKMIIRRSRSGGVLPVPRGRAGGSAVATAQPRAATRLGAAAVVRLGDGRGVRIRHGRLRRRGERRRRHARPAGRWLRRHVTRARVLLVGHDSPSFSPSRCASRPSGTLARATSPVPWSSGSAIRDHRRRPRGQPGRDLRRSPRGRGRARRAGHRRWRRPPVGLHPLEDDDRHRRRDVVLPACRGHGSRRRRRPRPRQPPRPGRAHRGPAPQLDRRAA